jgi:hypothetical protein
MCHKTNICSWLQTFHCVVLTGEWNRQTDNLETCFLVTNGMEYFARQPLLFV